MKKTERRRLARAEVWFELAYLAHHWMLRVESKSDECIPFEEWPDEDPFRDLCRRYDLTPKDLASVIRGIADQLEGRAISTGYDEALL